MKKLFLAIFATFSIGIMQSGQAQSRCGFDKLNADLLKNSPAYSAKLKQLESSIAEFIKKNGTIIKKIPLPPYLWWCT